MDPKLTEAEQWKFKFINAMTTVDNLLDDIDNYEKFVNILGYAYCGKCNGFKKIFYEDCCKVIVDKKD